MMDKKKKIVAACVVALVAVNIACGIAGKKGSDESSGGVTDNVYSSTQHDEARAAQTEEGTREIRTAPSENESTTLTELEEYLIARKEELRDDEDETSTSETETETALDEDLCYVSVTGTKYHSTRECYVLTHGGSKSQVIIISIDDAKWQGYHQCDMCYDE
jgi:hypothetical protein